MLVNNREKKKEKERERRKVSERKISRKTKGDRMKENGTAKRNKPKS